MRINRMEPTCPTVRRIMSPRRAAHSEALTADQAHWIGQNALLGPDRAVRIGPLDHSPRWRLSAKRSPPRETPHCGVSIALSRRWKTLG
jgi:hypothetical protein